MSMKKALSIILSLFIATSAMAAHVVSVKISDGLSDSRMKDKMEKALSSLLTEINAAQEAGRNIDFSKLSLSSPVQSSLSMLWENTPFVCADTEVVEHCITTGNGYQIRNIPLMMRPLTESDLDDEEYQEAVVSFDRSGNIQSFYISISMNLYMNVVKSNLELTDLRRRQLILDYVEQFRTSYNQKDINFLRQLFSDDALIITGRVIKQKLMDNMPMPDKIVYTKQSKKQYIDKLARIFAANKRIKVTFDAIEVMRHPSNHDFYGVTLHQGYTSDNYHDDGYIFILWDFRDEGHPLIHVRTWQPDQFNGKPLNKDDVFSLGDFDIQ